MKILSTKWINIYKGRTGLGFMYECGDYDESRHTVILSLIWISIYIKLPWKNKEWTCDPRMYGIETYRTVYRKWYDIFDQIYVKFGNKCWFIQMPWALELVYTAIKFKNRDEWLIDDYKTRKSFKQQHRYFKNTYRPGYMYDWNCLEYMRSNIIYEHEYTYEPLNQTSHCEYYVCERCWRPRWFKWTNLFSLKNRVIEVCFDEEMGPERGSWKGGVTSCSFDLKSDERPEECIIRMEKEYNCHSTFHISMILVPFQSICQ